MILKNLSPNPKNKNQLIESNIWNDMGEICLNENGLAKLIFNKYINKHDLILLGSYELSNVDILLCNPHVCALKYNWAEAMKFNKKPSHYEISGNEIKYYIVNYRRHNQEK